MDNDPCRHQRQCWCCKHRYCCDDEMNLCATGYSIGDICNYICVNCYNNIEQPTPICPDCFNVIHEIKNNINNKSKYLNILSDLRKYHKYTDADFLRFNL